MISLVVITCKDRVVYIEQDTERERQEIKPELPGVRVDLGEDDWDAKDDGVEDEGEYYPRPRRISGSEDNVDEVSEAVSEHRYQGHVGAPERIWQILWLITYL